MFESNYLMNSIVRLAKQPALFILLLYLSPKNGPCSPFGGSAEADVDEWVFKDNCLNTQFNIKPQKKRKKMLQIKAMLGHDFLASVRLPAH